ncbi:hypothetical protein CH263_20295 [Rhodococcus sp. 06-1059B-a]|nr:hypothetical protein [Rhodococcus sp. 06-1059B-a]OZD60833.1 hypothetical protein CH263_20295 [Rhodococcus sp. 06-1059B-a]
MTTTANPTAARLRIEPLTATHWWCLKTSAALWREHTAPPSRFTRVQRQQTVIVLGDGDGGGDGGSLRPKLGERR